MSKRIRTVEKTRLLRLKLKIRRRVRLLNETDAQIYATHQAIVAGVIGPAFGLPLSLRRNFIDPIKLDKE